MLGTHSSGAGMGILELLQSTCVCIIKDVPTALRRSNNCIVPHLSSASNP